MRRLTKKNELDGFYELKDDSTMAYHRAVKRLAEYENTGLNPKEVRAFVKAHTASTKSMPIVVDQTPYFRGQEERTPRDIEVKDPETGLCFKIVRSYESDGWAVHYYDFLEQMALSRSLLTDDLDIAVERARDIVVERLRETSRLLEQQAAIYEKLSLASVKDAISAGVPINSK